MNKLTLPLLLALATASHAAYADDAQYPAEWRGMIGVGVASKPVYPGSGERETDLQPVGKITYGRFFIGGQAGLGIGYNAFDAGNFTFGAMLSRESSGERKESDSPRLKGLGDIDEATRAGLFVSYRHDWLRANANVLWDVGGKDLGLTATLSAEAVTRATPALELSAGFSVTYGNDEYAQTAFGITPAQAARSGLPAYAPGAGAARGAFQLGASYALTPSWTLGARLNAGRLLGDSAKSPVVEKKAQNSAAFFVGYRF
jgi:outer membrane protein